MSDRDASISDAAFREALREYHSAAVEMATQLISADRWRDAEARVLALYAEREKDAERYRQNWMDAVKELRRVAAERQGEVYEVQTVAEEAFNIWEDGTREYYPDIVLRGPNPLRVQEGSRVRVTKVEEGL